MDSLEGIQLVLPATVELESHLDASEDHLLSALEVDAQLHNVAVVDRKGLRFRAGRTQPDVVQESAATALDILDVPLSAFVPELAMSPANHFRFEPDWRRRGRIDRHGRLAVTLRVPPDANDLAAGGEGS